jgi:ribokinase
LLSLRSSLDAQPPAILTVGSLNLDVITYVDRLPRPGETLLARRPTSVIATGGKGANQAVAAARLCVGTGRASRFVTQFGNDSAAAFMEADLLKEGVDVSGSRRVAMASGQGLVRCWPGPARGMQCMPA